MGFAINTVTLVGNLTRDPELKHAGDTAIANLGIAVNGSVKKNGEWVDRADFFDVTVFGKRAENVCQYLSKGSKLAIAGRLRQDRWETDSGENRSKVKIIADQIVFTGEKPDTDSGFSDVPADTSDFEEASTDSDDNIPF